MTNTIKIIRSAVGSMPSWGLIEELQKLGLEVIGIDANPSSFGLQLLEKNYVVPLANSSNFIIEIFKIIDEEHPHAILSGPEEELLILSKHKKSFADKGVLLLCPDYEHIKICSDKIRTYEFFNRIGIPTPTIYENADFVEFPCIIKPRFGRGSTDIYIAENEEDLHFYLKKVNKPIIQKLIVGDEYTVDVLADDKGNALSVVPRLRIDIESGISVKGKTVYDREIIDYCTKIAKELKLFGPSCIQCFKNEGGIEFIEVNTRFGGGSILSIKADPTILPNLMNIITGEKTIPSKSFNDGLTMLRYYSEVFIQR